MFPVTNASDATNELNFLSQILDSLRSACQLYNETNIVLQDVGTYFWQISAFKCNLDQSVVCKFIINYYTQFTLHKLVPNYV